MRWLLHLENVKINTYAQRTSVIASLEKFFASQIFFAPYFSCCVACLAGELLGKKWKFPA